MIQNQIPAPIAILPIEQEATRVEVAPYYNSDKYVLPDFLHWPIHVPIESCSRDIDARGTLWVKAEVS